MMGVMVMKRASPINDTEFWNNHISTWKKSGLTQLRYCEEAGISYSGFKNRRKLPEIEKKTAPVNFIRVNPDIPPMKEATIQSSGRFEILLPNGLVVVVSTPLESRQLQLVLEAAGGVQC